MVNAVVPLPKDKPPTFGWLQFEKKAIGELQKLAIASPAAMGTLMYLVNHMSRSNALVVSQKAIAEGVGIKRETANRALKYLADHHFVQILKAGGSTVYVVNSRVAWQGDRGARYAAFGADVIAIESEQQADTVDDTTPLKQVPILHEGERLHVGNEPIDPPDQGELSLP
jgi:Fe2+ or Zn2+ uptake regulation protein